MEYYLAIKKNEIMPFAATWMNLEMIILGKLDRERQTSYEIMWTLKRERERDKLIYLQNRNSLTDFENKLMGTGGGEGWIEGFGLA